MAMITNKDITPSSETVTYSDQIATIVAETGSAYELCILAGGHPNIDYAGFAAQDITRFRKAMDRPDLSYEELVGILRNAQAKVLRRADEETTGWAQFMAMYIRQTGNTTMTAQ